MRLPMCGFASVYREFKDVNTFFDELRKAVEKKKK